MIAKAKSKARTPLASAPYIPAQTRRLRLEVRQRTRSLGRGFTAHLINSNLPEVPAGAGGNPCGGGSANTLWIPACAGMTGFLVMAA